MQLGFCTNSTVERSIAQVSGLLALLARGDFQLDRHFERLWCQRGAGWYVSLPNWRPRVFEGIEGRLEVRRVAQPCKSMRCRLAEQPLLRLIEWARFATDGFLKAIYDETKVKMV